MSLTLPVSDHVTDIMVAARATARVLDPLTTDLRVDGLREVTLQRLGP
jgi:hypothetical protein